MYPFPFPLRRQSHKPQLLKKLMTTLLWVSLPPLLSLAALLAAKEIANSPEGLITGK